MTQEVRVVPNTCVRVSYIVVGLISNNVYFLDDGQGGVAVVDPSGHFDEIMQVVNGRKVSAIICTHNHWDHVGALAQLAQETGAPVYASEQDAPLIETGQEYSRRKRADACPVTRKLHDGDTLTFGAVTGTVISTPGHTPGCICLYLPPANVSQPDSAPVLVSGDTLFQGTHGRTDFAGGSMQQMAQSLARLAKLPQDTIVLPGHGAITTILAENPLFRRVCS